MRFTLPLFIATVITFNVSKVFSQGVGIGTTSFTPVSDALLELRSTSSGFLMPRMTQAQREAIASPSDGLMVYQTDGVSGYYFHNGVAWNPFGGDDLGNHTATTKVVLDDNIIANASGGDGIRISDAGNVGIGAGVGPPSARLEVISSAANANAITVQSTAANGWSSVDFRDHSGSLSTTFGFANSGTAGIFTNRAYMNSYDHDFILTRNSSERSIFISGSSGNVGINTDAPGQRLSVNDGNIRLQRTGGTAGEMQFQGTGAGITSFKAGAQGATNINYTLPTAAPVANGAVLASTTAGVMSWDSFLKPTTVVSTTSDNMNPASYSTVADMSVANVPAGTYVVSFNADIARIGSAACQCIVRAGGADVASTERRFEIPSTGASAFTLIGKVTLAATGTVEVRCRKIPGGNGFTVSNRSMTIQSAN